MSNSMYDKLKFIALLATPILTFLSALCSIWKVPCAAEFTASFGALDACIGAIVVVAKKMYEKNKEDESGQR